MKVVSYFKSAGAGTDTNKHQWLRAFVEGVSACGHEGIISTRYDHLPGTDYGVILGWYGTNQGKVQRYRQWLCQQYGPNIFALDADPLKHLGHASQMHLRICRGSVFRSNGSWLPSAPGRFDLLCERKGIQLYPYRQTGSHILIPLNSSPTHGRGWSHQGHSQTSWLLQTVSKIRAISNRPLIIRGHPNACQEAQQDIPYEKLLDFKNVFFSGGVLDKYKQSNTTLQEDCIDAWAAVGFSTSALSVPLLYGIPIFAENKDCLVYPAANTDLNKINEPELLPRKDCFESIAANCFSHEELSRGLYFEYFLKYNH